MKIMINYNFCVRVKTGRCFVLQNYIYFDYYNDYIIAIRGVTVHVFILYRKGMGVTVFESSLTIQDTVMSS